MMAFFPLQEPQQAEANGQREPSMECESSGRAKRTSAQVAIFHLREIANQELFKEWPKRKVQRDLVPDDRKVDGYYTVNIISHGTMSLLHGNQNLHMDLATLQHSKCLSASSSMCPLHLKCHAQGCFCLSGNLQVDGREREDVTTI